MKIKNASFLLPLTIGVALILSACGGGSSSTSTSTPPASTTLSSISSANSTQVAGNAHAANTAIDSSSSGSETLLTGVSIEGNGVSPIAPALDLVMRAFDSGAPKLLTGVSTTQACAGGGTIAINGTVQSQTGPSNGDNLTFTASNCVENTTSINGVFSVALSGITGTVSTTGAWGATLDFQYNAFSVTSSSESITVTGDMKIAYSQVSSTSKSLAISGKSLQVSQSKAGVKVADHTLTNYAATSTISGTTVNFAANYTMSGNSGALGQFTYTVKNLQPFVRTIGGTPTSGSMIISGASSSVTLTIIDANSVRLDFSAKGDGVITQTTIVSWTTLKSSL
jgi:hypothetical protein